MPLEPRTAQVMIRLTPEELDLILQASNLKKERMATAARQVLVKWAKRVVAT